MLFVIVHLDSSLVRLVVGSPLPLQWHIKNHRHWPELQNPGNITTLQLNMLEGVWLDKRVVKWLNVVFLLCWLVTASFLNFNNFFAIKVFLMLLQYFVIQYYVSSMLSWCVSGIACCSWWSQHAEIHQRQDCRSVFLEPRLVHRWSRPWTQWLRPARHWVCTVCC